MAVDISAIYQSALEHFNQARNNIRNTTVMFEHSAAAISDVIPGFEADKLEFEYYDFMSDYRSPWVFNKILQKP